MREHDGGARKHLARLEAQHVGLMPQRNVARVQRLQCALLVVTLLPFDKTVPPRGHLVELAHPPQSLHRHVRHTDAWLALALAAMVVIVVVVLEGTQVDGCRVVVAVCHALVGRRARVVEAGRGCM